MKLETMKSAARRVLQTFDPNERAKARAEIAFYRRVIGDNRNLIFDIGANSGNKTAIFMRLATRVVCVEPGIGALAQLHWRFRRNARVCIVPKGVGENKAPQYFHQFRYSGYDSITPKLVEARFPEIERQGVREIEMTTIDALLQEFGSPFYIKIDVEGYEHKVLRGLSRAVPVLSFECNLPEFRTEGLECIAKLVTLSPNARFNFVSDEPPIRFANDGYLSGEEMAKVLGSTPASYLEVYAYSPITS
jgi:FkbM family methyltransferase